MTVMKCRKCGAENPDDARYCRACGEALAGGNAMERLADYHFVPVSIVKMRGGGWARFFSVFLLPFFLTALFFAVYSLLSVSVSRHVYADEDGYEYSYCSSGSCRRAYVNVYDSGIDMFGSYGWMVYDKDGTCPEHSAFSQSEWNDVIQEAKNAYASNCWSGVLVFGAGALIFGMLFRRSFARGFRTRERLKKHADYVQDMEREEFVFMLKDDKFGVYNVRKAKVQIPTVYDKLGWKEYGQLLHATQGGRRYVMDIYGNELK